MNLVSFLVSDDLSLRVVEYAHPPEVFHKHFLVVLGYCLLLVILDLNVLHWLGFPLEDLLSAEQ